MIPRRDRISRKLFPTAITSGRRLSSAHFTAIVPLKTTGYAVVMSKKNARLSVTRHQIKRRVLGALHTLPLPKALILFPKPSVLHLDHEHIKKELAELLSNIPHHRTITL